MALDSVVPTDSAARMTGPMRFVGIATLLYGALVSLSIIGAVVGVPLVIAGLRLREAADAYERFATTGDPSELPAAFERQASFFRIQRILILVGLVVTVLYVVAVLAFAGTILAQLGLDPSGLPAK